MTFTVSFSGVVSLKEVINSSLTSASEWFGRFFIRLQRVQVNLEDPRVAGACVLAANFAIIETADLVSRVAINNMFSVNRETPIQEKIRKFATFFTSATLIGIGNIYLVQKTNIKLDPVILATAIIIAVVARQQIRLYLDN